MFYDSYYFDQIILVLICVCPSFYWSFVFGRKLEMSCIYDFYSEENTNPLGDILRVNLVEPRTQST